MKKIALLKDNTSFYKACFNSMQVGIIIFDSFGNIVIINRPLALILEYENYEITNHKVDDFFSENKILYRFIRYPDSKKFKDVIELTGITKNKTEVPLELSLGKVEFDGQLYFKAFVQDISKRKKREQRILKRNTELEEKIKLQNFELEQIIEKISKSLHKETEILSTIESRLGRVEALEERLQNNFLSVRDAQQNTLAKITNFNKFLSNKKVYNFKKGETIFCEGNSSNHIFFIKKGLVKTCKTNSFGKEFVTAFYADNQYFGYISFVKNLPHSQSAVAVNNTQIYKIDKTEVDAIVNNNKEVIYSFIDVLISNFLASKKQLIELAYSSVRRKTAFTLLKLNNHQGISENEYIHITRLNLANCSGIAKETLIRTLHDFNEENLIQIFPKKIKILDKLRLSKIQ